VRAASRLVSLLVALALLAGGLLLAGEVVVTGIRHRPWLVPHDAWYAAGRRDAWSSAAARWLSIAVAAAGLALVVVALSRRRPTALALRDEDGAPPAEVQRRSLEGALTRAAAAVDGVGDATVRIRRSRARVVTRTTRHDPGDLDARVAAAVRERLSLVGVADAPPVDVTVRRQGER
jgi:hypothetical protein